MIQVIDFLANRNINVDTYMTLTLFKKTKQIEMIIRQMSLLFYVDKCKKSYFLSISNGNPHSLLKFL